VIKPESLRQHLAAAIPELATHPDRMLVFIENGTLHCTGSGSLSFEYRYSLNLVLIEYGGHPDSVMIPLLAWLSRHQPELLENPQRRPELRFEVEVLANDRVDLSITLPLTERVGVVSHPEGGYTATHFPEPEREGYLYAETWQLFLREQLLAEWGGTQPPSLPS